MKKILFVTAHDPDSERKVDLHFIAHEMRRRGDHVFFLVTDNSYLGSLIRGAILPRRRNSWVQGADVSKYNWVPLFHPMKLSNAALRGLASCLFCKYPDQLPHKCLDDLGELDLVIVESGAGLGLVPRLKKKFPQARFVYSVSDRLERLDVPTDLYAMQEKALPLFDLIRVPSPLMIDDFDAGMDIAYIPHGLDRDLFTRDHKSPYAGPRNAVSIGDSLFDACAIKALAQRHPDWIFHLFGRLARLDEKIPNVVEYGETRFEDIVPYILHADIGLALYRPAPLPDYISHSSLRMIQYSFARLPIVTPTFSARDRAHACAYEPGDREGLFAAFDRATEIDRTTIDPSGILSWGEVTSLIEREADAPDAQAPATRAGDRAAG